MPTRTSLRQAQLLFKFSLVCSESNNQLRRLNVEVSVFSSSALWTQQRTDHMSDALHIFVPHEIIFRRNSRGPVPVRSSVDEPVWCSPCATRVSPRVQQFESHDIKACNL